MLAAGLVGYAVYRTLWPLVRPGSVDTPEMLGGRTRAALEREKTLLLRSIKELEFDRAMGKVSEADCQEMTARLRARAIRVIRQLDAGGAAYRELLDKELAARLGAAAKLLLVAVALGGMLTGLGRPSADAGGRQPRECPTPGRCRESRGRTPPCRGGTVSVRVVRGQLANLVTDHPVEFVVDGRSQTAKNGRQRPRGGLRSALRGRRFRCRPRWTGSGSSPRHSRCRRDSGVLLLLVASGGPRRRRPRQRP